MPNWCNNSIDMTGPLEKIEALYKHACSISDDGGLLEAMVPLGEWDYDRAVTEWGTKWSFDMEGLELVDHEDGTASITGWADSAWGPPISAFETYCENNEDVDAVLHYMEEGMCFIGCWSNDLGDECYEYNNVSSQELYDHIPAHIADYWDLMEKLVEWEQEELDESI